MAFAEYKLPDESPKKVGINELYEMFQLERLFVRRADEWRTNPNEEMCINRSRAIEMLSREYERFGISSGLSQTKLLVQKIERQTINQLHPRNR